jgi:hypothetical protein
VADTPGLVGATGFFLPPWRTSHPIAAQICLDILDSDSSDDDGEGDDRWAQFRPTASRPLVAASLF